MIPLRKHDPSYIRRRLVILALWLSTQSHHHALSVRSVASDSLSEGREPTSDNAPLLERGTSPRRDPAALFRIDAHTIGGSVVARLQINEDRVSAGEIKRRIFGLHGCSAWHPDLQKLVVPRGTRIRVAPGSTSAEVLDTGRMLGADDFVERPSSGVATPIVVLEEDALSPVFAPTPPAAAEVDSPLNHPVQTQHAPAHTTIHDGLPVVSLQLVHDTRPLLEALEQLRPTLVFRPICFGGFEIAQRDGCVENIDRIVDLAGCCSGTVVTAPRAVPARHGNGPSGAGGVGAREGSASSASVTEAGGSSAVGGSSAHRGAEDDANPIVFAEGSIGSENECDETSVARALLQHVSVTMSRSGQRAALRALLYRRWGCGKTGEFGQTQKDVAEFLLRQLELSLVGRGRPPQARAIRTITSDPLFADPLGRESLTPRECEGANVGARCAHQSADETVAAQTRDVENDLRVLRRMAAASFGEVEQEFRELLEDEEEDLFAGEWNGAWEWFTRLEDLAEALVQIAQFEAIYLSTDAAQSDDVRLTSSDCAASGRELFFPCSSGQHTTTGFARSVARGAWTTDSGPAAEKSNGGSCGSSPRRLSPLETEPQEPSPTFTLLTRVFALLDDATLLSYKRQALAQAIELSLAETLAPADVRKAAIGSLLASLQTQVENSVRRQIFHSVQNLLRPPKRPLLDTTSGGNR